MARMNPITVRRTYGRIASHDLQSRRRGSDTALPILRRAGQAPARTAPCVTSRSVSDSTCLRGQHPIAPTSTRLGRVDSTWRRGLPFVPSRRSLFVIAFRWCRRWLDGAPSEMDPKYWTDDPVRAERDCIERGTSMTKTRKHGLIAALICFWAISLACSSYAQGPGSVYGTYTGVESYQEFVVPIDGQPPVVSSSGSGIPATFSFSASPASPYGLVGLSITPDSSTEPGASVGGASNSLEVGSQSATGSTVSYGGEGATTGFFSATFEAIMPDGQIVGGLSASADIDLVYFSLGGGGEYNHYDVQFSAVPEPSSIVQGAMAILMLVLFAWFRGFRPRSWLRLS